MHDMMNAVGVTKSYTKMAKTSHSVTHVYTHFRKKRRASRLYSSSLCWLGFEAPFWQPGERHQVLWGWRRVA